MYLLTYLRLNQLLVIIFYYKSNRKIASGWVRRSNPPSQGASHFCNLALDVSGVVLKALSRDISPRRAGRGEQGEGSS